MTTTPHRGKSLWKRRRLWFALGLSVLLHLLLLPELDLIPEESHDRVILATLRTDTPERADDIDQRGELKTESRPLSSPPQPPAPDEPPLPTEPVQPVKADAPEQVTTTKAVDKVQAISETTPPTRTATNRTSTPQRTNSTAEPRRPPPPSEKSASLAPSASFQGQEKRFSDPKEQQYYEQLIAHLSNKLPAHPDGISGTVRLQIVINYGAVITGVDIIQSSNDRATDEWARRAVLSTSPVPAVPAELSQPYYFRPTLRLTN